MVDFDQVVVRIYTTLRMKPCGSSALLNWISSAQWPVVCGGSSAALAGLSHQVLLDKAQTSDVHFWVADCGKEADDMYASIIMMQ